MLRQIITADNRDFGLRAHSHTLTIFSDDIVIGFREVQSSLKVQFTKCKTHLLLVELCACMGGERQKKRQREAAGERGGGREGEVGERDRRSRERPK
jgi:hypothetical protein